MDHTTIRLRADVLQLLVDEHGITDATAANTRFDDLFAEALTEIDPTDGYYVDRLADWIADRI